MTMLTLQIESPSILARLKDALKSFHGVKIIDSSTTHAVTDLDEVPNSITKAAMEEAESGNDAGTVCMDNFESFIASMQ